MGRRRGRSKLAGPGVLAVLIGVVAAGAAGAWLAQSDRTAPSGPMARLAPPVQRPVAPAPSPVPQSQAGAPAPARLTQEQAQPAPAGRAAIVFDDAGASLDEVEELIAIGRPVAVAVLPGLAYSTGVARRAHIAGLEVLLHLPVESAEEAKALGPGGVTLAMSDAQIQAAVRSGLTSVPGAVGLNNHMGSKGTADRRVMRAIIEAVREAGLFFIDSRTTPDTVAEAVAAELGVPTARRLVFLDNDDDEAAIREQLRRLIALARERGSALAIGHVRRRTAAVLAGMLDEFDRAGVAIVPPSTLVR